MQDDDKKRLIEYWQATALHDFDTMQSLYESGRYDAALFFAHIVLEKALKALVVACTGDHAPYTHNLAHLAEVTGVRFSDEDTAFFREANMFNMEARYPEEKLRFYKLCTQEFTAEKIARAVALYTTLCLEIKQNV